MFREFVASMHQYTGQPPRPLDYNILIYCNPATVGLQCSAMGKLDFRTIPLEGRRQLWTTVERIIRQLRTPEAISVFLADLLTDSEHLMVARRIRIAQLLLVGFPHLEICRRLHVGIATVQSVDRWLRKGAPDYRPVFSPLYKHARQRKARGIPLVPYSFAWVRRKYPLHFLLFNLLLGDPSEADD